MLPHYWMAFIDAHHLIGKETSVSDDVDLSGVGIELRFLTEEQSADEATNLWPGIGVAKDGYVPVGACLTGSGDYYYINSKDGPGGPLYRIYHDAVDERGYQPDEAIALVLKSYEGLLAHRAS